MALLSFFEELDEFDDNQDEDQPSEVRRRGVRVGGRRQSGGGGTDIRRIALLVLAIVLIALVGYYLLRSCQRNREVDAYKKYVVASAALVDGSQGIATELKDSLLKQGQTANGLQSTVSSLATRQAEQVKAAQALSAPSALRDLQKNLVLSQQLRANGLAGLSKQFGTALGGTAIKEEDAAALALLYQRLVAGDIVYADAFKGPLENALKERNISGVAIKDSQWIDGTVVIFANPADIKTRMDAILFGAAATGSDSGTGDTSGKLIGSGIEKVVMQPSGSELSTKSETTVSSSGDDKDTIEVTIKNSGDTQLTQIQVLATLDGEKLGTQTIAALDSGSSTTVTFKGFSPPIGAVAKLQIDVPPTTGETNTQNNSAVYDILFTL